MKRFLLFVLTLAVGFSVYARKVEKADAQLVGKNFYYERANIHDAVPYQSIRISEEFTKMTGNEPAYYVYNINDNDGFIIVAADDASVPVLAYSFTGRYTEENMAPAFRAWSEGWIQQISEIREKQLQPDMEITTSWNRYLTSDVNELKSDRTILDIEPLITTTWNQDYPYNALCPEDAGSGGSYGGRVPVGCVATALSQIMYYWRYPETGNGSHCISPTPSAYGPQCANFGNTNYEWEGMTNSPIKECYPAALISYHCGVAVDMSYGPDGSGAYCSKIPNAIATYFKYATGAQYDKKSSFSSSTWESKMKDELNASRPVEYEGFGPDGGHAWVLDGYQGTNYFHFNWGWGGSYNGYYYLNNLNPGGSTFTNNQGAVTHIQPDPALYPANCAGNSDVNVYGFGTIEDGSGPVADYQNNANCSWLIAPDDSIDKVTLTFERFDTDPSDIVTVYDGNSTSAAVLGTFSGTTVPGTITSTGPHMLVTFVTNGSTTGNGWLASYSTTAVPFCNTSTDLTDVVGDFADGSGRFNYRNSTTCKWKIHPQDAVSLTLVINSINTEADKDIIEVYNAVNSQKLASFSGTTPPAPVTCPSGNMMVLFKTDNKNRGIGFEASYTTIVSTQDKPAIDDLSIYPNPADNKVNISFTLQAAGNVKMNLTSVSGVNVLSKDLGYKKGQINEQLNVADLAAGIYMLTIISDQGITTSRIVIR